MNPYQVLGVAYGTSKDECKKAYHRLAHIHHPDKGGDANIFAKISAAYREIASKAEPVYTAPRAQPDFSRTRWADADLNDLMRKAQQDLQNAMRSHNAAIRQAQAMSKDNFADIGYENGSIKMYWRPKI